MGFKILIAEDEDITRKHLVYALKREGYEAVGAVNGLEAMRLFEHERFDILITDVKMPEMSGIELLEKVKERFPGTEVMVITGFGSIDSAVEAMKKGAYEYITKPFNLDELILKVKNIYERKALKKENAALKAFFGMNKDVSIVARSESMRKIMDVIESIRDQDCSVLITGESGVGKSLLAKMIHFTSIRRNMPFLSTNCSALTQELLWAELFGSEDNIIEGPPIRRQGLIEIADGGTLFIDDISEMSLNVQARLSKVIEDGALIETGSANGLKINVRFIAAARRDIKGLIQSGGFLENLYYRLNVMEIFVPPLREHKEDIEPLSSFFLRKYLSDSNKDITGFSKEALDVLMNYSFPGNIKELENIIERAVILEKSPFITPACLPRGIKMYRIETFQPDDIVTIDELTREYAEKVLHHVGGDKAKAAELLGISEMGLWRILKGERII